MATIKKGYWIGLVIIFILAFESCKDNPTSPPSVPDSRPLISSQDYRNLILTMTGYDVVQITHKVGLSLRSPNVVNIEIGIKDVNGFNLISSSTSTYDSTVHEYILHFNFTIRMDSSKINAPLTIRYCSVDSTYSDVDTLVALYKYPYQSAQVFLDSSNLGTDVFKLIIQGISLSGPSFFFHPLDDGFYSYNLLTSICKKRWNYINGSHIASDSNYVFCDINHLSIVRYNLTTNTADSSVPYLGLRGGDIDGMSMCNKLLYVLIQNQNIYLKIFTLQGVLLDSISLATYPSYNPFFMAIYDSVIYSKDENNPYEIQISRFDLRTKSFLSNVFSPVKTIEAITIYNGKLYYSSVNKMFIGVIPVTDLVPIHSTLNRAAFPQIHRRAPNQRLKLTG